MFLISKDFFFIFINGSPSPNFTPSRGIRQGDPLSPYIFILVPKGLTHSINHALSHDRLWDLRHGSMHQKSTHQQVVDDTLLMGHPSLQEALSFQWILDTFSTTLGTEINNSKSHIFFFNTPQEVQIRISHLFGFKKSFLSLEYLGSPFTSNLLHLSIWEELLLKIQAKLSSWTFRNLNLASHLTLLKYGNAFIPSLSSSDSQGYPLQAL